MTKDELLTALNELDGKDPEADHSDAEDLLLQFINDADITNAWQELSQDWWYA